MFKVFRQVCRNRICVILQSGIVAIFLTAVVSAAIQRSYEPKHVATIEDLGRYLTPCGDVESMTLPD